MKPPRTKPREATYGEARQVEAINRRLADLNGALMGFAGVVLAGEATGRLSGIVAAVVSAKLSEG